MDRIITSSRDRSSLLSTHKVLRNTYFLLSLTLAFSAITATASTVLMLPSPGLILTLVGMYGLMFLTYKTANKPTGIISAFAFTGFLGYILGPMLNAYLSAGMGDLIGLALGGTALVSNRMAPEEIRMNTALIARCSAGSCRNRLATIPISTTTTPAISIPPRKDMSLRVVST